jgi:ketosteroid isomerase-like protein
MHRTDFELPVFPPTAVQEKHMRRFVLCAVAAAAIAGGLSGGRAARAQSKDEQQIRALENSFAAAFNAKDVNAIMKVYVPGDELLVFDVVPPRQYAGWDAYKKDWEGEFAMIPGPLKFEIRDLSVTTDGKLGWSHSIQHVAWSTSDGKAMELTVRVTDCYRKIDGKWLIVLEHVSVPVDLSGPQPVPDLTSKP